MTVSKPTKEELETTYTIDYVDKTVYVYTCHSATRKKLINLAEKYPDDVRVDKDDGVNFSAYMPCGWVKIRPSGKRKYTEEQKTELIARMLKGENK